MEVRIWLYLIDALIRIKDSSADHFTLTAWLLAQLLPLQLFIEPYLDPESGEPLFGSDLPLFDKLQQEADALIEAMKTCHAEAADTDAQEQCIVDASEELLQRFESYLVQLALPDDWQVAWMGVEG